MTDETRKRALDCKTPEEILSLAKEEGYELSDEELEGVSGGWSGCDAYEKGDCGMIGH
jgi:hypothetical protein